MCVVCISHSVNWDNKITWFLKVCCDLSKQNGFYLLKILVLSCIDVQQDFVFILTSSYVATFVFVIAGEEMWNKHNCA